VGDGTGVMVGVGEAVGMGVTVMAGVGVAVGTGVKVGVGVGVRRRHGGAPRGISPDDPKYTLVVPLTAHRPEVSRKIPIPEVPEPE